MFQCTCTGGTMGTEEAQFATTNQEEKTYLTILISYGICVIIPIHMTAWSYDLVSCRERVFINSR